jgi:hypothetical protein
MDQVAGSAWETTREVTRAVALPRLGDCAATDVKRFPGA